MYVSGSEETTFLRRYLNLKATSKIKTHNKGTETHLNVPAVRVEKLTTQIKSESSKVIQNRVQKARDIQEKRFRGLAIKSNAEMSSRLMKQYCNLDDQSILLLKQAISKLNLSARSFHRVVKIARTIADLEPSIKIKSNHVAEALQYRPTVDS